MEIELSNTIKLVFTDLEGNECLDSLRWVMGCKAEETLKDIVLAEAYDAIGKLLERETE